MDTKEITNATSGERIKKARIMTGLTRKDMHDKYQINVNTLQAWETNRNTLSKKSARNLSNAFMQEGICCDENWLLSGNGTPPFLKEIAKLAFEKVCSKKIPVTKKQNYTEEEKILRESLLFESHYNNATKVIIVPDDSMLPIYSKGDYVGGFIYTANVIDNLIGYNSIVLTSNDEVFFRKIMRSEDHKGFILATTNINCRETVPVIFRDNVVSVAPILWHRKKIFF